MTIHAYIKLSTLEYPLFQGDIRLEHPELDPNLKGENFVCPDTYAHVMYVDPPEYNETNQNIKEGKPVKIGNIWQITWEVITLTQAQIDANIADAKKLGIIK